MRRLLLIIAVLATTAAAGADWPIDSITVKWRDEVTASNGNALPAAARTALVSALQLRVSDAGQTRDGAFVFTLDSPVPIDVARAAINRARNLSQILYVNLNVPKAAEAQRLASSQPKANPQTANVTRLIVKYRDIAISQAAARNEALPPGLLDRIGSVAGQAVAHERAMSGGAFVVRLLQAVPPGQAEAITRALENDPTIEYAEPDLLMQPLAVPNDPLFSSQWDLQSPPGEPGGINMPPAWDITTGAASIVISIIDTGYLGGHPDLAGRFIGGYDFIADTQVANDGDGRDADPSDPGDWVSAADAAGYFAGCPTSNSSWHGTHVAGTIGAATNNSTGVAGINAVSKLLSARVLGKCGGYTSDIADAVRWSAGVDVPGVPPNQNPARVMNLSLGGNACDSKGQNCSCGTTMQSAINAALATNAVIAVAAGNSNADAITSSPANCAGVITVAATGRAGQRAAYSNYGALVEISAPGGADGQNILSTLNSGTTTPNTSGYNYVYYQGTSMATPHVAGVASLMLSVNPALTPAQVIAKMQSTARAFPIGTGRDCSTAVCGAGILDAAAAVTAALTKASTTTALTSSPNPQLVGSSVTFTATVSNGVSATGTVTFADSGTTLACGAVPLSGNTAACTVSLSVAGVHSIVATYSGDGANTSSSSSPLSQVINAPAVFGNLGFETPGLGGSYQYSPSGATWSFAGAGITGNANAFTSGNPSAPEGVQVAFLQGSGSSATQTANLNAGQYTISFKAAQRGNFQSGAQIVQVQVDGVAVGQYQPTGTTYTFYQTAPFAVGTTGNHTVALRGIGGGGSDFTAFVDDIRIAVAQAVAATSTSLTSSQNPANAGASVTFTATVTNGSAPSGTVNFTDGGASITGCASVPISANATATCTTTLPAGTHNIVANYSGDNANAASSSSTLSQVINGTAAVFNNLGFETPNLGGSYQYAPAGATWSFVSAGITGNSNAFTSGNPGAPEGVQVAFLQGPSASASQIANLAAGQYTISFKAAQRGNFQSGTQIVQVQVDGVAVGQYQPPGSAYTTYQTAAFTIAGSGNHTITLRGVGSGSDFTAFVDDVRISSSSIGFTNLGFESPGIGSTYQYSPAGATWTFTGAGITGNSTAFTSGNPAAPEGAQVAFLQGGGNATQTSTMAAGQYTISFKAAQRGNYQFGTQIVQVKVDGAVVGQFQPPNTSYTLYQTPVFTVATGGNHTISLVGVGTGSDFTAFVDDVQIAGP